MAISKDELITIKTMIESVKYGTISVIVQDGKIIQVEKNEKIRLDRK